MSEGTRIHGESDDLIEFDGDIDGEVGAWASDEKDENALLVCSDGTVLTFRYGREGVWRATILTAGALYAGTEVFGGDPDDAHSDIVSFQPGLKWAYSATEWERVS